MTYLPPSPKFTLSSPFPFLHKNHQFFDCSFLQLPARKAPTPPTMSESDVSETSESTLEPIQFEKVLESLETGASEALESGDYLSYSTLLDIYLSEPARYSYDEREQLLSALLSVLSANEKLTYEIGWDIPSLVILYIESDFDFKGALRSAPCVYKILKIFEALALHGNPKELFLKCCELLTSISISDTHVTTEEEFQEKFFDVKLYCIFELVDSCMKKIKTYYPSRFLAMTVASYINLVHKNANDSVNNLNFIMKRAFSFARNYTSPPVPDNTDGSLTAEELKKIKEDEEYIERKLLTGFITQLVALVNVDHQNGYGIDHLSYIQAPHKASLKKYFEFEVQLPVLDRMAELALSYDISLSGEFKKFLEGAKEVFDSFDYNAKEKDENELIGEIFEKSIIDYQKNLAGSIITSEANEIHNSAIGILILFTHTVATSHQFDKIKLSFKDAVELTLRLLIPQMIQSSFVSVGIQDVVVFWGWYSLHQASLIGTKIELEVAAVPSVLLKAYYQTLLFVVMTNGKRPSLRYIVLTYLSRVLTLSPEETSYNFIIDSLHNCPFEKDKSTLIGVLKELLTQTKGSIEKAVPAAKLPLTSSSDPTTTTAESAPSVSTKESSEASLDEVSEALSSVKLEDAKKEDIVKDEKAQAIDEKIKQVAAAEARKPEELKKEPTTVNNVVAPPPLPTRTTSPSTKYITLTTERLDDLFDLIDIAIKAAFVTSPDAPLSIDPTKLGTLSAYLNLLVVIKGEPVVVKAKATLDKVVSEVQNNIDEIKKKHKENTTNQFELNASGILEITLDRIRA
ncbi:YAP1 binding protein 2 [Scheffersomyces xylosifermentans]|uniref:YAP1 binding protein 2 n=1 Tax=Scheffersomyces xylosifermentans TaxID=1304137 RepID=UPI00315DF2E0